MANFTISMNYLIVDNVVHLTGASISAATTETISENCSTSVAANGDINLDSGDTATLSFNLGNDDNWHIQSVQLKDKDKSQFGQQPGGGYALDDDEEQDYPDVDQETGTITAQGTAPMSISFSDTNQKGKTVDYQVVFHNLISGLTIVSDPRVRDGGGAN